MSLKGRSVSQGDVKGTSLGDALCKPGSRTWKGIHFDLKVPQLIAVLSLGVH